MENSQKGSALLLIVLIVGLVAIAGTAVYYKKFVSGTSADNSQSNVSQTTQKNNSTEKVDNATTTTSAGTAIDDSKLKIYTNSVYGYGFKYSPAWNVTESTDKKEVNINNGKEFDCSKVCVGPHKAYEQGLTIKIVNKSDFGVRNTKLGSIEYDSKTDSLIDHFAQPPQCLVAVPMYKNNNVMSFGYGGSTMSDPAYSNNAIITNKGYIIDLAYTFYDVRDEYVGIRTINSSFRLINGVTFSTGTCTANPSI